LRREAEKLGRLKFEDLSIERRRIQEADGTAGLRVRVLRVNEEQRIADGDFVSRAEHTMLHGNSVDKGARAAVQIGESDLAVAEDDSAVMGRDARVFETDGVSGIAAYGEDCAEREFRFPQRTADCQKFCCHDEGPFWLATGAEAVARAIFYRQETSIATGIEKPIQKDNAAIRMVRVAVWALLKVSWRVDYSK